MSKNISRVLAVILWLIFLIFCYVFITHFIPHFLSWTLDGMAVLFLMIDLAILQGVAWLYKKLPHKPNHWLFSWLEKVVIFGSD